VRGKPVRWFEQYGDNGINSVHPHMENDNMRPTQYETCNYLSYLSHHIIYSLPAPSFTYKYLISVRHFVSFTFVLNKVDFVLFRGKSDFRSHYGLGNEPIVRLNIIIRKLPNAWMSALESCTTFITYINICKCK
jgi:hypothetical protein